MPVLRTPRLTLRGWTFADTAAALDVYGHAEVARWLSPEMTRVPTPSAMRLLITRWIAECVGLPPPAGRWAIERDEDKRVVGGAVLLRLPPGHEDLEIGWQLHPDVWGNGYASEATYALAGWAFSHDVDEIFAVVRPDNARAAATVRRNGMLWVGETRKYFDLDLEIYRLRSADLKLGAQTSQRPPGHGNDD
nr:GNAT family N-acetyltransferase [Herbihabitans rhizosphaerae]